MRSLARPETRTCSMTSCDGCSRACAPLPVAGQSMLMRIIAVILGLAAIMIGMNAIRYSVTPDSEQQLVTTIRRWRSVPGEDSRVLQLVLELQQRRAARNIRTNASFGFCGLLILLAMGAWQY